MPSADFYHDHASDDGVTCKRCGAEGLHWDIQRWDARGREVWRLYDEDDELHECAGTASADEFEDVS